MAKYHVEGLGKATPKSEKEKFQTDVTASSCGEAEVAAEGKVANEGYTEIEVTFIERW
jgi:hypothetical protein